MRFKPVHTDKVRLIAAKTSNRPTVYEIATFFQYAVADGIHRLLFAARSRPRPTPTTDNSSSPSPNRRRDGAWGNSCSLSAWHWPFYAYN